MKTNSTVQRTLSNQSSVMGYCICNPRGKKNRRQTQSFCSKHRRFVCENCVTDDKHSHSNCDVKKYNDWVKCADFEDPPKCTLCSQPVSEDPKVFVRLACFCLFHQECLKTELQSSPAPRDQIMCKSCSDLIFPKLNRGKSTALRAKLFAFLQSISLPFSISPPPTPPKTPEISKKSSTKNGPTKVNGEIKATPDTQAATPASTAIHSLHTSELQSRHVAPVSQAPTLSGGTSGHLSGSGSERTHTVIDIPETAPLIKGRRRSTKFVKPRRERRRFTLKHLIMLIMCLALVGVILSPLFFSAKNSAENADSE
eukprot:118953_1